MVRVHRTATPNLSDSDPGPGSHPLMLNPAKLHRHRRTNPKCSCNICGKSFKPHTRYERYCDDCRHDSEIYRFADWIQA